LTYPTYGDVFEFLSSLVEFMQLDPPTRGKNIIDYLVNEYKSIVSGHKSDRNTLLLLYRTRLLIPCTNGVTKLKVFRNVSPIELCPKSLSASDIEIEEEIVNAMLNWHPIRILIRYLAWRGGEASIDDIVRDLGCAMKRLTRDLYEALRLVVPDERTIRTPRIFLDNVRELCGEDVDERGVLKPFNRRRVKELLLPILESLKLAHVDNGKVSLTEVGTEYSRQVLMIPQSELVITEPLFPQTYVALLSVLYRAQRYVYIISPWVEVNPDRGGLLLSLLKVFGSRIREIVMILRDDEHNRRIISKLLSRNAFSNLPVSIYLVKSLHAKMYLSLPALMTSANLLYTSIGINYEVGMYYPVAPKDLIEFKDLLLSAASRV